MKNANTTVLKEVRKLSKEAAQLIAILVKEHRLNVITLMVNEVMNTVQEIDDAAEDAAELF